MAPQMPSSSDGQQHRRLSRWASMHAWKLAGLTAFVTFMGVFIAVSLSLVLRPTRSYFFPLLSDVDKHQPEGAILRVAFVAATALLIATTSASVLHCQSMRFFTADASGAVPGESPATSDCELGDGTPHLHNHLELAIQPDIITPSPTTKRRAPLLNRLQLIIVIPMTFTVVATFMQYSGLLAFLNVFIPPRRHIATIGLYILGTTWTMAMCFLVWYFLKLQGMPDRIPDRLHPPRTPDALQRRTFSDPTPPEAPHDEPPAFVEPNARIVHRFRAWATWLIVILRPICLTGQVVCVIKIVGLWLALDTFAISNIRLVKIALLAALAFAEYTAAFFFAFFMTILAVDMRAKATAPEYTSLT